MLNLEIFGYTGKYLTIATETLEILGNVEEKKCQFLINIDNIGT